MILTSYRKPHPEDWKLRNSASDPSVRRMIYGPIQSMDEDRTLLWRLFHTGWIGRLVHVEARSQFAPPSATVQLIPSASRGATESEIPDLSLRPATTRHSVR
jgi:hypothetical protein